jgi:hypothetical protein
VHHRCIVVLSCLTIDCQAFLLAVASQPTEVLLSTRDHSIVRPNKGRYHLERLDKRSPNVSYQKIDSSNGAGFRPILPPQHWTKWCMTVNIWFPRYLAYWDITKCLLTQSVFENYIDAIANFSYFTFASSQVVSESPSRMSTRSLLSLRLNRRIAPASPYIPLPANRLHISSASGWASGARPIRSKIASKSSPLMLEFR